ncbi:MAG TPA: carotenoid 1,2-hydratase [Burkholderiales bacterium]|nr:carotenoid 1,2-hydratase [Burkholderiales bacterium]
MKRRRFLLGVPLMLLTGRGGATYPPVRTRTMLRFPRDHGAHPDYRTEWWYITGWLKDTRGRDYGVQVTFFRNRPKVQEDNPSAFAPRQLLFAHAAIADPRLGRLRADERVARAGFGLARFSETTTEVAIDDWSLRLEGDTYRARIVAREFEFDLAFRVTQPILLQGIAGFSRKGPRPAQASYYYSRPHLALSGRLQLDESLSVQGEAWLDHEWSSEYLAREASGWDWTGINLNDGGALMAFRIRGRDGGIVWAGGTYRDGRARVSTYRPSEIVFAPLRRWRSPRSGVEYPVAMAVDASGLRLTLEPLMDDQELDSRASTGTIYWEGAVRARREGVEVGRGYLELTGYWQAMKL